MDYEMELVIMSKEKLRVVYDVGIDQNNLSTTQPLHFLKKSC
jgi:hypothetical protein